MEYLLVYVCVCGIVGILGMNRKLGFWGYFFLSLLMTPIIGFVVVCASDPKCRHLRKDPKQTTEMRSCRDARRKQETPLSEQNKRAISFGYQQARCQYERRIAELVNAGKINQQYADDQLNPLLQDLRQTLQFHADGTGTSPLDRVLIALENLPDTG